MGKINENNVFASLAGSLHAYDVTGIQVNLGRFCNQSCKHCHLEASPARTEMMGWEMMQKIVQVAARNGLKTVEITGGAPELNPHFRLFITELNRFDFMIKVRTNLTALLEPGLEGLALFLKKKGVKLAASLPCYQEKNVEVQRGEGVFSKSIAALQMLNKLGYGTKDGPELEIVFNPGGSFLPGSQKELEDLYRREMKRHYGITFSRLLALTNMPVGRFRCKLLKQKQIREYLYLLYNSFNRAVLAKLMCRSNISVDWDGTLYDCDFNLALRMPVAGVPARIGEFNRVALAKRNVVTGEHCLGCTAGEGSSCGGALAEAGR